MVHRLQSSIFRLQTGKKFPLYSLFVVYILQFFMQKPLKNFERVEVGNQQSLDYTQYDLDDDQNLIFYNGQNGLQQNFPERPLGEY